jgi:hypothetical protein
MPRISERAPLPVDTLLPHLRSGITEEIGALTESLNKFDPLPYGIIPDFLTPDGLAALKQLEVPLNGKCPDQLLRAHPVGGPLAATMGRISLANMDLRSKAKETVFSLKNETGEGVFVEPHRDLLDGHATLFNYGVLGELYYVIDGERLRLDDNALVVLNGAAVWGDITNFLPGEEGSLPWMGWRTMGGVTSVHGVESTGPASRNRLLVYAGGRETVTTQIPPDLPPWF